MFFIIKISLFLTLLNLTFHQKKIKILQNSISNIISRFNSENLTNYNYNETIDYIKKIFSQYAFIEILKSHPNKNFNSTDIIKKLDDFKKEINNNTKFYNFYQKIIKIIQSAHDQHIDISFSGIKNAKNLNDLNEIFILLPFKISIDENKKTTIFPNDLIEKYNLQEFFPSYQKIKSNSNINIKSINNSHPFEFIRKFGEDFLTFKNKNAKFTYTKFFMPIFKLKHIPMNEEFFNDFSIEYENNEKINVNFIACLIENNFNNKKIESNVKKINFIREISNKKNELKWDFFNKEKNLKCKIDNENKINVYYQNSFHVDEKNLNDLIETLFNCYNSMQKNNFPIFVIEDFNGGGFLFYSEIFIKIVQNLCNQKNYFSIMKTNLTQFLNEKNSDFVYFNNEIGFYYENFKEFLKTSINENLNNVNLTRTIQREIDALNNEEIKRYFLSSKKIRKPTEIVIFTDGFSFSATSIFIKSLQNFGGAIVVGYNGDPESETFDFDASQSPTFIEGEEFLKNIPEYEKLIQNGFKIGQISYGPSYKNSYNFNIKNFPQEFEEFPIDERMNFFNEFEETNEIYNKFIEKGKEIIEKYKFKCNVNNTNLKLLNKSCDKNFNSYTFGGNVCNKTSGNWSNECQPFYCDFGYYFDYNTNSCLLDYVSNAYDVLNSLVYYQNNEKNLNDKIKDVKNKRDLFKYLLVFESAILVLIGMVFICKKCFKVKKVKELRNKINNISLVYEE